jgi:hypothetical protein
MSAPDSTPLAGQRPSLEERLRELAQRNLGAYGLAKRSILWEAADELARLRADVERLTAANERLERWKKIVTEAPETADRLALAEQVRPIVAVWKDRLEVAEARAERYRVALEKITDAAPRDAEWFQFVARRALTEGAAPNPSNSSNSSTAATEGADHAEH